MPASFSIFIGYCIQYSFLKIHQLEIIVYVCVLVCGPWWMCESACSNHSVAGPLSHSSGGRAPTGPALHPLTAETDGDRLDLDDLHLVSRGFQTRGFRERSEHLKNIILWLSRNGRFWPQDKVDEWLGFSAWKHGYDSNTAVSLAWLNFKSRPEPLITKEASHILITNNSPTTHFVQYGLTEIVPVWQRDSFSHQ